jgi:hypothetical protein
MDDLEGFFYVLCHLVFLFSKPGVPLSEPPEILSDWTGKDNFITSSLKAGALGADFPLDDIPVFWGDAVRTLVDTFRKVVLEVFYRKARIAKDRSLDRDGKLKALAAVSQDVDIHFGKVKAAFETAISELEERGLSADELEPNRLTSLHATASSSASSQGIVRCREPISSQNEAITQHSLTKKRTSEDGQARGTPHKRQRNAATAVTVDGVTMRRGVP